MYHSIRLFVILAAVVIILLISKKNRARQFLYSAIFAVFFISMYFIPIENLFCRFPALEDSFHYTMGKNKKVLATDQEDSFGVVFYNDGYLPDCKIIQRDKKGWEVIPLKELSKPNIYDLPSHFSLQKKTVSSQVAMILVHDHKNEAGNFMINTLIDSQNSKFHEFKESNTFFDFRILFAYVNWPDPSYSITINGESAQLSSIKPHR